MTANISAKANNPFQSPRWSRVLAQLVSYVFHPLFVPILVVWLILYQHPINYLLTDAPMRLRLIAMKLLNTVFLPGFVIFLLWRLKFIPNMYLELRNDRIIPLSVVLIFYSWAFYVGRNLEAIPLAMQQWLLGVFLASCAAIVSYIFFKISLHIEGNSLYFDVYNSVHPKQETDPERSHQAIGLENVKQRLQLLYKKKHELIIRENANEYFVHLTVQLA